MPAAAQWMKNCHAVHDVAQIVFCDELASHTTFSCGIGFAVNQKEKRSDDVMKVALYARVSMDEGADDKRFQDSENQLMPLREFCKASGWEIYREYVDKKSGADSNRPEFRAMLQDAALRRFNGILIWKLDRFSREGIVPTMSYIRQLKDRQIWLRSLTESWFDTQDAGITEVILAILSWASAEERKKISERTKAGIARRRAIGQWRGGRPRKKGGAQNGTQQTPA
ncbi:MAG: recombinase family protein [Candidatus Micrarchaeota archaeon]